MSASVLPVHDTSPQEQSYVPYGFRSPEELARLVREGAEKLYETQPRMSLLVLFRLIWAAIEGRPIKRFKL